MNYSVYPYPFLPEMMPAWHVIIFIFGACVGSFLNVCIWRIPRDESLIFPESHCPKCNHKLSWFENIPLLSWTFLNGKCRKCKEPISFRYFFVELLTAVMFLMAWLKVTWNCEPLPLLLPYFTVVVLVVTTTFIDIDHRIIPNEITFTTMILGLAFSAVFPSIWNTDSHFVSLSISSAGLVAGLGGFALFAILGKFIFKREALGWGDVKYLGAVGACLGITACLFTVVFGAFFGSIGGIIFAVCKKRKLKKATIPFGPYLAAGTYVWMLYGQRLLLWYLDFLRSMAEKH
jgi:leader peptidase (prepilin peptidase)/N-methyltransferase